MRSPPVSPSPRQPNRHNSIIDLQGASHVTGGILRGRAQGNVFNNADADLMSGHRFEHRTGQVQVYTAHADLNIVKADMELTHEVMPKLPQVLKTLAHKYSPVRSMVSSSSMIVVILTYHFLR